MNKLNLKNYSDQKLLSEIKNLVQQERELLTSVLQHLREIDLRRLYADLKYKSLFEYATQELGYPEDAAYRRINAMRMLRSLPADSAAKIEKDLGSGDLCLTHLSMAQTFFRKEEKISAEKVSAPRKIEILDQLKHKSTREAEKVIQGFSSLPFDERKEIKLLVTEVQEEKIEKLKGLLAHRNPGIEISELFDLLLDIGIETFDRSLKMEVNEKKILARRKRIVGDDAKIDKEPQEDKESHGGKQSQFEKIQSKKFLKSAAPRKLDFASQFGFPQTVSRNARYIPSSMKREVWRRDRGVCVNCGSRYALEIEHCRPVALGGTFELSNLKLLCRSCNQRAAVKTFGVQTLRV